MTNRSNERVLHLAEIWQRVKKAPGQVIGEAKSAPLRALTVACLFLPILLDSLNNWLVTVSPLLRALAIMLAFPALTYFLIWQVADTHKADIPGISSLLLVVLGWLNISLMLKMGSARHYLLFVLWVAGSLVPAALMAIRLGLDRVKNTWWTLVKGIGSLALFTGYLMAMAGIYVSDELGLVRTMMHGAAALFNTPNPDKGVGALFIYLIGWVYNAMVVGVFVSYLSNVKATNRQELESVSKPQT